MDPASLIPAPDDLPVAWPWLKAMLIPCFGAHLLFMNALVGSSLIGWVRTWRPGGPTPEPAGRLGKAIPFYMAFAINFGVAALLFLQVLYGHFFYTSSILMAVWWLSVPALVMAAYGAAYWIDLKSPAAGIRRLAWTLMVVLLLTTAFIFVNNLTLMQDPGAWSGYFKSPGGTHWHWNDAALIPRYFHFVAASVAVAGLASALKYRHGPADRRTGGLRWFAWATAVQLPIGAWFFFSLPAGVRSALTGGDVLATVLFAAALGAAAVSLVFSIRRRLWPCAGAAVLTVLAMVLVRDAVRTLYLAPVFDITRLPVRPQHSPMVVFGLFLAAGGAAVGYMVRLYLKAKGADVR